MNMHMTPHPRWLYLAFDALAATRDKPQNLELAARIIHGVEHDQFSDYIRTSSARWALVLISSVVVLAVLDLCTWIARFH